MDAHHCCGAILAPVVVLSWFSIKCINAGEIPLMARIDRKLCFGLHLRHIYNIIGTFFQCMVCVLTHTEDISV